jgi:tyrosyl-tRNA synthetase
MHGGDAPSSAPVVDVSEPMSVLDLLADASLVKSRGEGRRLVAQGGVRLNGETVSNPMLKVHPQPGQEQVLQAGKTRFLRLAHSMPKEQGTG